MKSAGILIYAKDLEAMTSFYRDVMQFHVVEQAEGWVELEAGGISLALHAIPSAIATRIVIETPPRPRSDTALKPVFQVDDLERVRARLEAAQALLRSPAQTGSERVDAFDTEGNVFSVSASAPRSR